MGDFFYVGVPDNPRRREVAKKHGIEPVPMACERCRTPLLITAESKAAMQEAAKTAGVGFAVICIDCGVMEAAAAKA